RCFGPLLLGDIALCSPYAGQRSVFLDADQVAQKVFRISVYVYFAGFRADQVVAATYKGSRIRINYVRFQLDEETADPPAEDLIHTGIAVRSRKYLVAFSDITTFVKQIDLFVFRQRDWYRLVKFITPNPFRTVRKESAVAVVAILHPVQRSGSLDGFPAPVSHGCYQIDLFVEPAAPRILMDGNSCDEVPILFQGYGHHGLDSCSQVQRE